MLKIAAEGGPEKNRVYCPIPPLKPFKFASRHLFSCSGSASGFCSRLVLFQKNHLFCLLFHFISKTPPPPPSHLRTGNLGIPCFGSKFSSAALRAAKISIFERFRQMYGLNFLQKYPEQCSGCNGLGGQHFLHIFNLQTAYALDITCKTKNNEDSAVSPIMKSEMLDTASLYCQKYNDLIQL